METSLGTVSAILCVLRKLHQVCTLETAGYLTQVESPSAY